MKTNALDNATLMDLAATAAPAQRYSRQDRNHFPAKRLDAISGRALECLAHAIEYLEDEGYACENESERVATEEAIVTMKRLNREIFAAVPALPERRSLLRLIVDRWERAQQAKDEATVSVQ